MIWNALKNRSAELMLIVMAFLMLAISMIIGYYKGVCYALENVQAVPIDERVALIDIDETAFPFLN